MAERPGCSGFGGTPSPKKSWASRAQPETFAFGSRFSVSGFGFRVSGSGFQVSGFRVSDFGIRCHLGGGLAEAPSPTKWGSTYRVLDFRFFGFQLSSLGFRVPVSGFRFPVSGYTVYLGGGASRVQRCRRGAIPEEVGEYRVLDSAVWQPPLGPTYLIRGEVTSGGAS